MSSYSSTVAVNVLDNAELRIKIMEHLPMTDLVSLARVDRSWHHQIHVQPAAAIRRHLFRQASGPIIRPLPRQDPYLLQLSSQIVHENPQNFDRYWAILRTLTPLLSPSYNELPQVNMRFDVSSSLQVGTYRVMRLTPSHGFPLTDLILESNPSASGAIASRQGLKQFVTQPPVTTMHLTVDDVGAIRQLADLRGHIAKSTWVHNADGVRIEDMVNVLRSMWSYQWQPRFDPTYPSTLSAKTCLDLCITWSIFLSIMVPNGPEVDGRREEER